MKNIRICSVLTDDIRKICQPTSGRALIIRFFIPTTLISRFNLLKDGQAAKGLSGRFAIV
jgi:hypothetical protein